VKISNFGRKQNAFGIIASPKPAISGYCRVSILGRCYLMHVLVCTLFNGPRPTNKHTVHHIDANPRNNHANNLRWATPREQRVLQNRLPGHKNPKLSKPVIAWKYDTKQMKFDSLLNASEMLGIPTGEISLCVSGKRKSSKGYKFRLDTDRMQPDTIIDEEWKHILDGRTQISNIGRYRSKLGIVSTPSTNRDGYVSVHIDNKFYRIHTLICEAWHGPKPTPQHTVDHINGIRSDNRVENLRWATRREQSLNQRPRDRTSTSACKPLFGKLVESDVWIRFKSISEAAKTLHVNKSQVSECARGIKSHAGGYVFSFENEEKYEGEEWEEFVVADWLPGGKYHV